VYHDPQGGKQGFRECAGVFRKSRRRDLEKTPLMGEGLITVVERPATREVGAI
jgi:hypothetical protein